MRDEITGTDIQGNQGEASMGQYLLIESRDPYDSGDAQNFYDLAGGLAKQGHDVTLFLVQNGVLPARQSTKSDALAALAGDGVEVLADEFSLQERGISSNRLVAGVKPAPLDVVVDQLAGGRKALWH
jgi:sulfur relay (sulfurtransferase) complex TusBCD TusD component (DsrE family)